MFSFKKGYSKACMGRTPMMLIGIKWALRVGWECQNKYTGILFFPLFHSSISITSLIPNLHSSQNPAPPWSLLSSYAIYIFASQLFPRHHRQILHTSVVLVIAHTFCRITFVLQSTSPNFQISAHESSWLYFFLNPLNSEFLHFRMLQLAKFL